MSKLIYVFLMVGIAGFLLRLAVGSGKKNKFERKPATPWVALNDDVDPTL